MGVPVNQKNAHPTHPANAIANDETSSTPSVEAVEPAFEIELVMHFAPMKKKNDPLKSLRIGLIALIRALIAPSLSFRSPVCLHRSATLSFHCILRRFLGGRSEVNFRHWKKSPPSASVLCVSAASAFQISFGCGQRSRWSQCLQSALRSRKIALIYFDSAGLDPASFWFFDILIP